MSRFPKPTQSWFKRQMAGMLVFSMAAWSAPAYANNLPSGYESVSGSSSYSISEDGMTGTLTAVDSVTIGNWTGGFNIGSGYTLNVVLPEAGSHLSHDLSGSASQIFGTLNISQGTFFLVNTSGIHFAPSSQINAAGLVASTLNLQNQDFLNAQYHFAQSGNPGFILSEGQMTIGENGLALLAGAVQNTGVIQAHESRVVLAGGEQMTLSFDGMGLLSVIVDKGLTTTPLDAQGNPIEDGVSNRGLIKAPGGQVYLTAEAAKEVFKNLVNQEGVIEAVSTVDHNGTIELVSNQSEGIVRNSGTLDASGMGEGLSGGTVHVLGEKVGLFGGLVDVSGQAGGGTILIGGDYRGLGTVRNAEFVYISPASILRADALKAGDGGRMIAWSEQATRAYGIFSAKGGPQGGDGGLIETSSHQYLDVEGSEIDASSPMGLAGEWLLDPFNLTVSTSADANGAFSGGDPDIWTPSATGSNIQNTTINTKLNAGTSVTLNTSGGGGAEAGTITISGAISKTAGSTTTLTFNADDLITLNNVSITGATGFSLNVVFNAKNGVTLSGGGADVRTFGGTYTVNADSDANGSGTYSQTASGTAVVTAGGAVSITADDIDLTGTINSGGASTTLLVSDGGTIGLGSTAGNFTLSGAELGRITATGMTLGDNTNGSITVDNITAANSNNISSILTLNATKDNAGVTFSGTASTFNRLAVNADDGIVIGVALTTDAGVLTLDGDFDDAADSFDNIQIGANLVSADDMTLSATTGGIDLTAGVSISTSNDPIVFNDKVDGAFDLTVNSGSATTDFNGAVGSVTPIGDGTGAAITLSSSSGLTTFGSSLATASGLVSTAAVTFAGGATIAAGDTAPTFGGLVTLNGGTYLGTTSTHTFNGGLTVSGGTFTGSSGDVDVNGVFTLSGGTFTAPSGTFSVSGNFTHTAGGTFTHNSGSVLFDGAGATINVSTTETFNNMTINSTGTKTISSGDTIVAAGSLTLTDGTINTGTLEAQGNVTIASTFDGGSSPLLFSGSANQNFDLTGAEALFNGNVTVNKTSGTVTLLSDLTMDASGQDLTVSGGGLNLNGFNLSVADILTVSGGTLTQGTGTITTTDLTVSSGTFSGGSGAVTVNDDLTISDGTFTSTSGTLSVADEWTHTAGGTFAHNSGTVEFTGANTTTFNVITVETFKNVIVNKTDVALAITSGDTLLVEGTLNLTNGTVTTGTLEAQGNVTVASTFDGGSGSLLFSGSSAQNFDLTGAEALFNGNVTVNKTSGTVTLLSDLTMDASGQDFTQTAGNVNLNGRNLSVADNLSVNGGTLTQGTGTITANDLVIGGGTLTGGSSGITITADVTITSGTLTSTSGILRVGDDWTHTAGGTFTHNSGTVIFDSATAGTLDVATTETFNNVTIDKTNTLTIASGDTLLVGGTLTLTDGTVSTGTLEAQGNVTVASTFDGGNGSLLFSGASAQNFDLTGAEALFDGSVTVDKTSGTVTLLSNLTLDASGRDLTITNGTLNLNGFNLSVADNLSVNGGTLTQGTGTISANDLIIGGGTFAVTSTDFTIGADFTMTAGNFTAPSGTFSVGDDWSHTGGTFNANGGEVRFTGSGTTSVTGSTTFYDFTSTVAGKTFSFDSTGVQTIAGTFTLTGTEVSRISIVSSTPGTQAEINVNLSNVTFASVSDSKNTGSTILSTTSVDLGNNSGWDFAGPQPPAPVASPASLLGPSFSPTQFLLFQPSFGFIGDTQTYLGLLQGWGFAENYASLFEPSLSTLLFDQTPNVIVDVAP